MMTNGINAKLITGPQYSYMCYNSRQIIISQNWEDQQLLPTLFGDRFIRPQKAD